MAVDGSAATEEHGGNGDGCNFQRRRVASRASTMKLRAEHAASSGLQLWRGQWLRLRLEESNTMVALYARDSQRLRSYR